jgi:four helix bundle protein
VSVKNHNDYQFDFEKLDVYQFAVEFTNDVFNITLKFKREIQYSLGDQFRRAALSICNNLAEGSRKTSRGRVQFFNYSMDSARECIPMITLSGMQRQISTEQKIALRTKAISICKMLHRLIEAVERSSGV